MQIALRIQTMVQPKGRLEVIAPELPIGKTVEVIILLPETPDRPHRQPKPDDARQSVVDILAQASGRRLFKTAEEVDAYLQQERALWDN